MTLSAVSRCACILLFTGLVWVLQACSSLTPQGKPQAMTSSSTWQPEDQVKWDVVKIPGKVATQYSLVRVSNRSALMANAISSASMLRKDLHIDPEHLGRLKFSWQIKKLIDGADMAHRDHDDSPVRLVLAFDGDRSQFSAKNAMLSELSHVMSGRPMPYATLMYVWCNHRPVESVIQNPRTDRIQKIVVESGNQRLNQWLTYERNIHDDFVKAFGEPPGALIGIGLMTDSDNTRSHAQAWYGPVQLMQADGKPAL
jgi:hypothetical protein